MPHESVDEDTPEPARAPAAKKRKAPIGALIGVLVVIAILLVPWLLRNTIATSMAKGELESAGVSCDERFAVEVAALFGSATVQPTRCTLAEGHVEAIEVTTPAEVELSGLSPSSIRADHVRITLRDREVRNGSSWARELRRLNLEARVAGLVKGMAELSELPLPPASFARVEVQRGGDDLAQIDGATLAPGEPMTLAIDRVVFAVVGGAGQLTLSSVTGSATPSHVHLEGAANARAGIALFGVFSQQGTFELDATQLDAAQPRFRLRSSF